ncbi:17799_t:CDS:2 [Cetraspora pellucida]|uniref:17799_t:CDS:1 n=1 Tax=Cetraspora pellucida TaxID=1433469 RepID=A0A9N9D3N0_9GLOM|nr:17799_t:CDS:2 [Cetraspora pellucida]
MCNNQIEIAEGEVNREYNEVAIPYTGTLPIMSVEDCLKIEQGAK